MDGHGNRGMDTGGRQADESTALNVSHIDQNSFDPMTLVPWKGRAILLVDLDAFFASVEQLDHPEWRGKPVIVGGDPDKRGVVSTASYEARVFGVHSAMASAIAARLCPDAIWTHGNFKRYSEMSDKVMGILLDESPLLQQVSIDEAFLDVTPGQYMGDNPVLIAHRIQDRVAELGITCSIGIGTSKTIAKIASDMDKPRGITVVYPGSECQFLSPLPVRTMSGIGKQTEKKLHELGVTMLGELAELEDSAAHAIFGINADLMRNRCRGIDPSPVETSSDVKSVSNEMTFSADIRTREEIADALLMISSRVGRRLRRKGLSGNTVTLKMKYDDLSVRTARRPLPHSTDDESVFGPVLLDLIDELWSPGMAVRLLGAGISGFEDRSEQLTLLEDTAARTHTSEERRALIEASDAIKGKFGDDILHTGRDLKFKDRSTGTAPQNKDQFH